MSYRDDALRLPNGMSVAMIKAGAAGIAARADARIAELEREIERLDAQWRDELRIYRETDDARIAELEAEVSGLRVDAERWRKLRGMHWSNEDDFTVTRGRSVKLGFLAYSGEQLDAAIDAARANGGGE